MTDTLAVLLRQFDTAWALTNYHLQDLSTEECLWRPAAAGLHVHRGADGRWRADWPDHEGYDLGPASIGWITWHMVYWWSSVLDHSFGPGQVVREDVVWPGSAAATVALLQELADRWRATISALAPEDLESAARTRWPFTERPFADVIGWATVELTKNAAELGYARFLYAVRTSGG